MIGAAATSPRTTLAGAALLALLSSGCGTLGLVNLSAPNGGEPRLVDKRRSPGRVAVKAAPAAITAALSTCGKLAGCDAAAVQTVGRFLGSYRAYPRRLTTLGAEGHGWKGRKVQAADVGVLLERAFSKRLGLRAVTVDAWQDPDADAKVCRSEPARRCAVISEREPPWARLSWDSYEESRTWASHNHLGVVLSAFAARWAAEGKGLYIHLHDPMACAMSRLGKDGKGRCNDTVRNIVRRVAAIDGSGKRLAASVRFVSESRDALELAHKQAEDMGLGEARVGYVLVAGSHFATGTRSEFGCGIQGTSAQVLDKARRADLAWMSRTSWLDTVWVQPRCFSQAIAKLRGVNGARATAQLAPLSVGVATWSQDAGRTAAWMKAQLGAAGPTTPKVSALVFDIDED